MEFQSVYRTYTLSTVTAVFVLESVTESKGFDCRFLSFKFEKSYSDAKISGFLGEQTTLSIG